MTRFTQMAWLVDDLDAAVNYWRTTAAVGPFFVGEHIGGIITGIEHRGKPIEIDMSVAVVQAGPLLIELIHQHDAAPSPYRDVFDVGEGGLHHVQAFVPDVPAQCATYRDLGFETVMTGLLGGQSPVAYVDARASIGCLIELMENDGPAVPMYAAVAAAADDWDGVTDPVRDILSLMG